MKNYVKIQSARYPDVILRAVPGHFITPHAHVNYYLDFTPLKFRSSEAHAAAKALSSVHYFSTPVDTIIALEGTEIIAGYLADELTQAGVLCKNAHKSIYVIPPEYSSEGQLIFRDSLLPWIKEKNVLLLFSAITTGSNAAQAIESLRIGALLPRDKHRGDDHLFDLQSAGSSGLQGFQRRQMWPL